MRGRELKMRRLPATDEMTSKFCLGEGVGWGRGSSPLPAYVVDNEFFQRSLPDLFEFMRC
jgi:hypothetical protein